FRPGTRFASSAIRHESFGIETYSPYLDKDMEEDLKAFDAGDLELVFGDSPQVLAQVEEMTTTIANDGKIPFMIGGEHSLTSAPVKALLKKYPDLHMIHFDAHTDLREDYLGNKWSHASVIKRCHDMLGDGKINSFGIRSGMKEEFYWAKEHIHLQKFNFDGLAETVESLKGKPVYFTLDLDVFDPSIFPGTGTPEAGGVSFEELRQAVLKLKDLNIVGLDVMELSPHYDQSGASTAVACKIIREILLTLTK
ncbi:MAG: agmatinase, partial [Streptococcaceae bacterium]|nr:agmatinase [Streptococcaceae bacterium]